MSFYINNNNPNRPGGVGGNPTNGICEKVLIQTRKIFDACVSTSTESGILLNVTDFTPANPTLPLTYISSTVTPNAAATVTDLVIDRLDNAPNFANVSMNIQVPITVTYRDANGVIGTGTSSITISKAVVLFVPQPSATPIDVTASVIISSQIGTFTAPATFTITSCIQVIIRVSALVDLLVPSYGYPVLPPCQQSCGAQCPGIQGLPTYPTATANLVGGLNNLSGNITTSASGTM